MLTGTWYIRVCKYIYISSPLVLAALNPKVSRLVGIKDQHSPTLHFVEKTEASEAKQEAEKQLFTEPSPILELPQISAAVIL